MSKLKVNELDTRSGTTITVVAGKTLAGTDIVGQTQIADNAIGQAQLTDNAVGQAEMRDNAVGTNEIIDLNVTTAKLPATVDLTTKTAVYVPAATVTAHVTAFDPIDIRKDIATLALHVATDRDLVAHDTMDDTFVDIFQDSSGIATTTTCQRSLAEYMASIVLTGQTVTIGGNAVYSTTDPKIGTGSVYLDGTTGTGLSVPATGITTEDYTYECWFKQTVRTGRIFAVGDDANPPGCSVQYTNTNTMNFYGNSSGGGDNYNYTNWSSESATAWKHIAVTRTSGLIRAFDNGVDRGSMPNNFTRTHAGRIMVGFRNSAGGSSADIEYFTGYIDEVRFSNNVRYAPGNFTPSTTAFTPDANTVALMHMDNASLTDESTLTVNAAGNWTSVTQTASGTVSKMTIIVLYKNAAGTTALNSDLVAEISANNGTNYQTVTLVADGTFSTGVLRATASNVTITNTGTAPKYRMSFANQSSGSKETQVYGVSLIY